MGKFVYLPFLMLQSALSFAQNQADENNYQYNYNNQYDDQYDNESENEAPDEADFQVSLGNSNLTVDESVEPNESLLRELETDEAPPEVQAITGEDVEEISDEAGLNQPASSAQPSEGPDGLGEGQGLATDEAELQGVKLGEESDQGAIGERESAPLGEPLPEGVNVGMNIFGGASSEPFRRLMAPGEAPETYVVQHGDTLEDICDQLLDEPEYWPKLWSFNPQIKNPHFIYPGMILNFYPGDESFPPYLAIQDVDRFLEESPADNIELATPELVSQAPLVIPEDLFARLPQNEIIVTVREDVDELGSIFFPSVVGLQVPAFIYADEQEKLGNVLAGAHGRLNNGIGDEIIVQVSADAPAIGAVWTVLRPGGAVFAADGEKMVGYRYEFVAHARFNEVLADSQASAIIIESRLGVREGDILVSYRATKKAIAARPNASTTSKLEARVIGFEHYGQAFGGQGSYVFVSKSVQPGTSVAVYQSISKPLGLNNEKDLPQRRRVIGVVQIIDATDVASVGYAVSGDRPFRIDDFAG